jgi:dTDP-4-dehydrorhamnose reductase
MKILLTGSEGFVASRFYAYYRDRHDIIPLKRSDLDITDEKQVLDLFRGESFDAVFHAAAIADIGACAENPELARKVNYDATVNIAKGCALKNSILAYCSSDQVYTGGSAPGSFSEDISPIPGNVYAQTKLDAEEAIAGMLERYYSLRLTWMFSLPERGMKRTSGFLMNIIKAAMSNQPITLSDEDHRGITYVYEVAENFEKLLRLPSGSYNYGSENSLTSYEMGGVALDALGLSHRKAELLRKSDSPGKDLLISNAKLKKYGVTFSSSADGIRRCASDFAV